MSANSEAKNTAGSVVMPPSDYPAVYPLLLTQEELVHVLRIDQISRANNPDHVIENLKRMHGLPCIHISKTPLYPYEAIRRWIDEKARKESGR